MRQGREKAAQNSRRRACTGKKGAYRRGAEEVRRAEERQPMRPRSEADRPHPADAGETAKRKKTISE
jgi:hypothetical protein